MTLEKRVKAEMILRDLAYGLAELALIPLAPLLPGARKCLQKLRDNRNLAKDRLTVEYSGLFDRAWYVKQYPDAAASRDPVMHYLRNGAKQGHDPSPAFDTRGYLHANPDVAATGANPLAHYIRFGLGEGRLSKPGRNLYKIPETAEVDPAALPACLDFGTEPTADIAVVCHIFYCDLWQELAAQIGHIPQPFDLYVTITEQAGAAAIAGDIRRRYPAARIKLVANHGRDIYPFAAFVNSGLPERYPLVCKIHTKRSPHLRHGETWRRDLVRGILGSPDNVSRILHAFAGDEKLGLVVADGHLYNGAKWWAANKRRCEDLARRVEIDIKRYPAEFAGGSIFWIRGSILGQLRGLGLEAASFERETGALDGTTAHAIERLFSVFTAAGGYKVAETGTINRSALKDEAVPANTTTAI